MSCIQKILEKKSNKKYIICDMFAVESGGQYKGYDFLITFTHFGARCGYVAVNENQYNKLNNLDELDVHGEITFSEQATHIIEPILGVDHSCGDIWLGFDAAHAGDYLDRELACDLWPDKKWLRDSSFGLCLPNTNLVRTNEFMTNECFRLIDQISERIG